LLATSDLKRVRMAGRYFQRPENAISKSDEFIKVGKCTNMDAAFATDCKWDRNRRIALI
jgi:hypothetical protein